MTPITEKCVSCMITLVHTMSHVHVEITVCGEHTLTYLLAGMLINKVTSVKKIFLCTTWGI